MSSTQCETQESFLIIVGFQQNRQTDPKVHKGQVAEDQAELR